MLEGWHPARARPSLMPRRRHAHACPSLPRIIRQTRDRPDFPDSGSSAAAPGRVEPGRVETNGTPLAGAFDDEVIAHMVVAVAPALARALVDALLAEEPDPGAVARVRGFAVEAADSLRTLEEMGRPQ